MPMPTNYTNGLPTCAPSAARAARARAPCAPDPPAPRPRRPLTRPPAARRARSEIRFTAEQLPTGKAAKLDIFTYEQLEQKTLQNLKLLARNMREKIGEDAVPAITVAGGAPAVINWILDVQVSMCASVGLRIDPTAFGAPWDLGSTEKDEYFGGDGEIAACTAAAMEADHRKPLTSMQPAHRGLSREDAADLNMQEAAHGAHLNRERNRGQVVFG